MAPKTALRGNGPEAGLFPDNDGNPHRKGGRTMDQGQASTGDIRQAGRPRHPGETPAGPPADRPSGEPERRPEPDEDQIGILPGRVPGRPADPDDPRFPGSQPDTA